MDARSASRVWISSVVREDGTGTVPPTRIGSNKSVFIGGIVFRTQTKVHVACVAKPLFLPLDSYQQFGGAYGIRRLSNPLDYFGESGVGGVLPAAEAQLDIYRLPLGFITVPDEMLKVIVVDGVTVKIEHGSRWTRVNSGHCWKAFVPWA
jgi:hypothetical protein